MLSETTTTPVMLLTDDVCYITLVSAAFELEVLAKQSFHSKKSNLQNTKLCS